MKVKDRKSLILASSSKRRLELLSQINIKPDLILPTNIDETPLKKELPKNYSIRVAHQKAIAAYNNKKAQSLKPAIILAADTVSAIGRRIMPKAENNEQVRMLSLLSLPSAILLLDEIVSHLDSFKRQGLFEELQNLQIQSFLTGTSKEVFDNLININGKTVQFLEVS